MAQYTIDLRWVTNQEAENDAMAVELGKGLARAVSRTFFHTGNYDRIDGDAELESVVRFLGGVVYPEPYQE